MYPGGGTVGLVLRGHDVPSLFIADEGTPDAIVRIPTTQIQDASVREYQRMLKQSSGPYNLYDKNCASTGIATLKAAGVDVSELHGIPESPIKNLSERYGFYWVSDRFKKEEGE